MYTVKKWSLFKGAWHQRDEICCCQQTHVVHWLQNLHWKPVFWRQIACVFDVTYYILHSSYNLGRNKYPFLLINNYVHSIRVLKMICAHKPVADPGFSPGGGANSQKCYYFSIFCRKLHENERIWTPMTASGVLVIDADHLLDSWEEICCFELGPGIIEQECIPVGCVPPARNCTGASQRPPPDRDPPGHRTPLWTDRHLWKHNLRKLRMWAVMKSKS